MIDPDYKETIQDMKPLEAVDYLLDQLDALFEVDIDDPVFFESPAPRSPYI